jgi:hypothetical protein
MSVGIDFTTAGLIDGARRRSSLPSSQNLFYDPDFIALINDHMISFVIPLIKSVNEEYFVVNYDTPLVANQSEYTIPTRALGGALRDIAIVDANGRETQLARIAPEAVKYSGNFQDYGASGIYLRGEKIVFYPALTNYPATSQLRFKYERRPNDLCLITNAGKILTLDQANKKITLDRVPTAWGTSTTLDIISPIPQFESIKDDAVIVGIVGTTVELSAWPAGIAAGQYCAESLTSPIAQLPYEAHKLLQQLGAIALLESAGDTQGITNSKSTMKEMTEAFKLIITPRVEGSPQKVVNKNSIFSAIAGGNNRFNTRP